MTKRKPRSKGGPAPLARKAKGSKYRQEHSSRTLIHMEPGRLVIVAFRNRAPEVGLLMGPEPSQFDPAILWFDSKGNLKPFDGKTVEWEQIIFVVPCRLFDSPAHWLDKNGNDVWDIAEEMENERYY